MHDSKNYNIFKKKKIPKILVNIDLSNPYSKESTPNRSFQLKMPRFPCHISTRPKMMVAWQFAFIGEAVLGNVVVGRKFSSFELICLCIQETWESHLRHHIVCVCLCPLRDFAIKNPEYVDNFCILPSRRRYRSGCCRCVLLIGSFVLCLLIPLYLVQRFPQLFKWGSASMPFCYRTWDSIFSSIRIKAGEEIAFPGWGLTGKFRITKINPMRVEVGDVCTSIS